MQTGSRMQQRHNKTVNTAKSIICYLVSNIFINLSHSTGGSYIGGNVGITPKWNRVQNMSQSYWSYSMILELSCHAMEIEKLFSPLCNKSNKISFFNCRMCLINDTSVISMPTASVGLDATALEILLANLFRVF